jgi:hypothetical protein
MKSFKTFLHFMITGASLAGFLGGWVVLAHSPKPVQPVLQQVLQPLEPLPPIGQVNSEGSPLQSFLPARPSRGFSGAFVTRGS